MINLTSNISLFIHYIIFVLLLDDENTKNLKLEQYEIIYKGMPIPAISIPCVNNLFEAACLCNNAQIYDNNNNNNIDYNNINNSSSSGSGGINSFITNSSSNSKSSSNGNGNNNSSMITGQPTEVAILLAAKRLNIMDRRNIYNRLEEIHFTSEMKFMEVIYDHRPQQQQQQQSLQYNSSYISNSSNTSSSTISIHDNNQQKHYLKGALEVIMPKCVTFIDKNGELALLSVSAKERVLNHAQDMSNRGLRVIAVACGDSNNQLTLCGIIGLMDPLRAGMMMIMMI